MVRSSFAASAAACGLTFLIVKSIFGVMLSERREKDLEDIEGSI